MEKDKGQGLSLVEGREGKRFIVRVTIGSLYSSFHRLKYKESDDKACRCIKNDVI